MNNIYLKYKTELDTVKKYINNKYIYNMYHDYGFTLNNKFIELDSNINIYEACFISQLIQIYIKKYKTNKKLSIVEVGLAFGTSAIVIINEMLKYKYKTKYIVIDLNQTAQWKRVGIDHINSFLSIMNKKMSIKLIELDSTIAMKQLSPKYDISFIDASHDEKIVIEDLRNSDRILIKNGLIIMDDVLHIGVKNAIFNYFRGNKNYIRISIDENNNFKHEHKIYNHDLIKQSFNNPKTMYCFQKLN